MFNKVKEDIKTQRFATRVRIHLETHKEAYFVGGLCLIVGGAISIFVARQSPTLIVQNHIFLDGKKVHP